MSRARRGRLLIVSALAVGATGIIFLVGCARSGAGGEATADVVRVSCRDGRTVLASPSVNVQADGVHVSIDADFDEPVVTFLPVEGGTYAHGLASGSAEGQFVMPIPPGDVTVECAPREIADPSRNAASVHLADPSGVWHDPSLACGQDVVEWGSAAFYYTEDNPFPEAFLRTLPGLRPDDIVSFVGYPEDPIGEQPVVVRDGEVIGMFNLSTYDQRTFVTYGVFCKSTGIVEPEPGVADMTSTPFHLPDAALCDPYAGPCSSLYLSAVRYEGFTGEAPDLVKVLPMAMCVKDNPDTCVPDANDMIVRVMTSSDDAERFVDENACGATEETACA